MGRFKLSMIYAVAPKTDFNVVVKGDLGRFLDLASSLGYEGVEYNVSNPFEVSSRTLKEAAELRGLKPSALSTGLSYLRYGYSLSSRDEELRENAVRFFKGYVDLSAELGCRKVVIGLARGRCGVPGEADCGRARQLLRRSLEVINDYALERGVTVVFEPLNRYETKLINSVEEALNLIKGLKAFKLLLDTFHATLEEASPYEAILKAEGMIGHVHVADSNRLAPGMGIIDWERVVLRLMMAGYKGYLSVEAVPKPSYEGMLRKAAETLKPIIERLP